MRGIPSSARWGTAALLGIVLTASGCGSGGLSKSHPVKGKVVYKDGDVRQLQGATVEFKSASNPDVSAEGEVQADGSFAITTTTSKDGLHAVEGVLPGEHRVRVIPPNPLEAAGKRLIDPRFQDFDRSGLKVQVPPEGEVVLEVHRPRR